MYIPIPEEIQRIRMIFAVLRSLSTLFLAGGILVFCIATILFKVYHEKPLTKPEKWMWIGAIIFLIAFFILALTILGEDYVFSSPQAQLMRAMDAFGT